MASFMQPDDSNDRVASIPRDLPILPLRNTVAYPFSVLPLVVGVPRSVKLIEDALQGNRLIGLVSMKDGSVEEPLRHIAENAGLEGSVVIADVRKAKKGFGLNAATGEIVDLVADGLRPHAEHPILGVEGDLLFGSQVVRDRGRLTDPEIDHLIKIERDHQYHPPYSLEEKFEHIYNLTEMILADCEVTESEKKVIKKFAIEAGFEYSKIDKLIDVLIEGVKSNYEEERLFRKFKKVLLS